MNMSMSSESQRVGHALSDTIGVLLIGTFISLVLYGVSLLQVYRYMHLYPKDSTVIKAILVIVVVLETFHTILPMHTCYYYLVSNFGNFATAQDVVWSINLLPIAASLVAFTSQLFFARRVSLIGPFHKAIAITAISCLLASVGLSIFLSVQAFKLERTFAFTNSVHRWISASLALAAIPDYMLSGAIWFALRRSQEVYPRNHITKLEYVTLYVLNTGLLTGVVHGLSAIFAIVWPAKLTWSAIGLIAIKLYAITLLAVLNSRKLLISRGVAIFDTTDPLGRNILARANHLAAVERWNAPRVPDETPTKLNIMVAAEIEVDGQIEGGGDSTSKGYGGHDSLHSSHGALQ